ncbi:MAG: VOC family protein [Chloroflexota bacterium]|nr:VOC family protein [Chloroflexota bacterium]
MKEKQQFNVYLTSGTIKQMKHRAVDAQLSLSDLVENVFAAYLAQTIEQESAAAMPQTCEKTGVTLQPMLHVDDMGTALDFYGKLGATVLNGSRDGDWALLRFGDTELGLLAHPANPEQNEGKVELNFEYSGSMEDLEKRLREAGVTIVRPVGDEEFGYQLQIEDADGLLIKINQIGPALYG